MTDLSVVPDEVVPSLAECEEVIERGLHSFVEVGQALMTIREQGYYAREFDTFEDYCRERWNMDRTYAHRTIEASEVTRMLPIGNTAAPTRESHARELVPLMKKDPDHLAEAWSKVIEKSDGKPTAKLVKQVVSEYVKPRKRGRTSKADEDTELEQDIQFLYLAITRLAGMRDPFELVAAIPDAQAFRIDPIGDALEWLMSFEEAWQSKQHDDHSEQ